MPKHFCVCGQKHRYRYQVEQHIKFINEKPETEKVYFTYEISCIERKCNVNENGFCDMNINTFYANRKCIENIKSVVATFVIKKKAVS